MKVTIENVRKHDKGLLRGFFDLKMEGLMTIVGCSVFCKTGIGGESWWISMPAKSYQDKDGATKWQPVVEMPSERLQSLMDLIMDDLRKELGCSKEAPEQAQEAVPKHRQWHSTEKGAKAAPAKPEDADPNGWCLPNDSLDDMEAPF